MRFVVRVVALVVAAVAVGAAALGVTSRNALDDRRADIEAAWRALQPELAARYEALATANDAVRANGGGARAVVGELDAALADWDRTARSSDLRAQLQAANELEGLGRRLTATLADSPRLASDASNLALAAFTQRTISAKSLNSDISAYADDRGGVIRSTVADLLDHPELPLLDL